MDITITKYTLIIAILRYDENLKYILLNLFFKATTAGNFIGIFNTIRSPSFANFEKFSMTSHLDIIR